MNCFDVDLNRETKGILFDKKSLTNELFQRRSK